MGELVRFRIVIVLFVAVLGLAAVANPIIAIQQIGAGNWGGAALFAVFSVVSWAVLRNAARDLPRFWRQR